MAIFRKTEKRRALAVDGTPIHKPTIIQRTMIKLLSNKLRAVLANWKTTLGGVALVAEGIAVLTGHAQQFAEGADLSTSAAHSGWAMIIAGAGLIMAKDGDKTGVPK